MNAFCFLLDSFELIAYFNRLDEGIQATGCMTDLCGFVRVTSQKLTYGGYGSGCITCFAGKVGNGGSHRSEGHRDSGEA